MTPETQLDLVRAYGQLPMSNALRNKLHGQVPADTEQVLQVAFASLKGNGGKPAVRVSNIDPARIILDEELEAAWADKKPAKAALDTSVSRGNALLSAKPLLKKSQPF
jgi:sn-glycerol 3-phosphate transport system substrate-binding protein